MRKMGLECFRIGIKGETSWLNSSLFLIVDLNVKKRNNKSNEFRIQKQTKTENCHKVSVFELGEPRKTHKNNEIDAEFNCSNRQCNRVLDV